jgi:REP element-mobilizing transposase RayT
MSYVKIWIHAVWGTKNHQPILHKEVRKELFTHIRENAREKGIYMDMINGYTDHAHCLLALNADMTIAQVMQQIKGESSFWANKNKLIKPKLEWAKEYYAFSVSESMVQRVREYIKNQEEHHAKVTFKMEYEDFIEKYKLGDQG